MRRKYKCKECGYNGKKFIFQFTDYSFCTASNDSEPEFISRPAKWVQDRAVGEAEIGKPVGCPKCHAWGVNNFKII